MSWLINSLGALAGDIVTHVILPVLGTLMNGILQAVVTQLVLPILQATVFAPFSLAPHTAVGAAALKVWATMGFLSAGVALAMLAFAAFSRMAFALGGAKSWAEIGEGLAIWTAVLVGGWTFLNLLLGISNAGTRALVASVSHSINQIFAANGLALGGAASAAAVFTTLLWPISGLLLVGLLLWAVGVWLMRQVDLVLYAGLLPVTAALGIGGNTGPFKWAWSEAMGAVFNQLAMALVLWVGAQFVTALPHHPTVAQQFKDLGLAATTFTLAARAPQLLANITGHRSAGAGHVLAGMALGYLGGRGLAAAARMTPAGQAVAMAAEGRMAHARAQVTGWAGRPSVAERLKQSSLGRAVSQRVGGAAGAARDAVAHSRLGQAAQAFAEAHPTATQIARNTGSIAGRALAGAARPLQTAASFAYQPMATLGHLASRGVANASPEGPSGLMEKSRSATVYMAQYGVEAAAKKYFGGESGATTQEGIAQLGHLVNARITRNDQGDYQPTFAQGAWQGALYHSTRTSVLKNIPVTRDGRSTYAVGARSGGGGAAASPAR